MANDFKDILDKLNKEYGQGTVISGLDTAEDLEVVDSGSLTLNRATSIGGIPVGKLIEIYGPESSGKSTISLHAMERFQKAGKKVALFDFEQSFDRTYATNLGLNMEDMIIVSPESQEDGWNIIEKMVSSGKFGLIVIDSHTAMVPKKMIDGEVGDATMGLAARNNSQGLAKVHRLLKANNCTILAISQLRSNIGGMTYGDPNIPTGGNGWKFYSDMRMKIYKSISKDESLNRTTVEVVKNKCGVPYGKALFSIVWGKGIDNIQEIIDMALEREIIKQAGAWFTVEGQKFQGNKAVHECLSDNLEFLDAIKQKLEL